MDCQCCSFGNSRHPQVVMLAVSPGDPLCLVQHSQWQLVTPPSLHVPCGCVITTRFYTGIDGLRYFWGGAANHGLSQPPFDILVLMSCKLIVIYFIFKCRCNFNIYYVKN